MEVRCLLIIKLHEAKLKSSASVKFARIFDILLNRSRQSGNQLEI